MAVVVVVLGRCFFLPCCGGLSSVRSVTTAAVDAVFCGDNGELRVRTERVRGAGVLSW